MNKEEKPIPDHEYDGIQEFNYPAPFWWTLFFIATIIFSIGYYFYYEIGNGKNSDQRLEEAMAQVKKAQIQNQPQGPDMNALAALMKNSDAMKVGKEVYLSRCAACHAADGGGLVGPNLTDHFWMHGTGTLADIYKIVHDGDMDNKGMPGWANLLKAEELNDVVAYVKTLEGTKPQAPKAPQGTEASEVK